MEGGRKPFLIRVDPQLLKELEGWAQEELRSLNGQIEYLLKQAVQRRKRDSSATQTEIEKNTEPKNH